MSQTTSRWSTVKPALCESTVLRHPIAPCEILPRGHAGLVEINGTRYTVEIVGYLPAEGEPVIVGYRLTRENGVAHDVCVQHDRLECTCADWLFRRSCQSEESLQGCKHCACVAKHFQRPSEEAVPVMAGANECCFLCDRRYVDCQCCV